MKEKITTFLKHPTSLHVIINTFGNYLNIAFALLFVFILTRIFTPTEFGVFTILMNVAYVLAPMLDFGSTATIFSYLPPLMDEKGPKLNTFIKSMFIFQSTLATVAVVILLFAFPSLDTLFFKTGAPVWNLTLTALSVLFFVWQNFILNMMYAAKKFVVANVYQILANVARLIAIGVLVVTKTVVIGNMIFITGLLGPAVFFIGLLFQKRTFILNVLKAPSNRSEIRFKYTLTYFIASQFYGLGMRMDIFLLSFYGLKLDVGFYGLAQKIIVTIITTCTSITQVLSPGFSHVKSKAEVRHQFRIAFTYILVPVALFLILAVTPDIFFQIFFTGKFVHAAPLARSLALPFILNALASVPMLYLLYTVKKPIYILFSNATYFVAMTVGCLYFIPKMGVYGAIYTNAGALFILAVIVAVATLREYNAHH